MLKVSSEYPKISGETKYQFSDIPETTLSFPRFKGVFEALKLPKTFSLCDLHKKRIQIRYPIEHYDSRDKHLLTDRERMEIEDQDLFLAAMIKGLAPEIKKIPLPSNETLSKILGKPVCIKPCMLSEFEVRITFKGNPRELGNDHKELIRRINSIGLAIIRKYDDYVSGSGDYRVTYSIWVERYSFNDLKEIPSESSVSEAKSADGPVNEPLD